MAGPNVPLSPGQDPQLGQPLSDQQENKSGVDPAIGKTAQGVLNGPPPEAEKTSGGVWSWVTGAMSYIPGASRVASAAKGIAKKAVASAVSYSGDKEAIVAEAKQAMLAETKDYQFLSFFEMLKGLAVGKIASKLDEQVSQDGFVSGLIKDHNKLVLDLVEINLAKGFVNLAKQASEKKEDIPGYGDQPFLVTLLSLICQKGSSHIDAKKIRKLEEKYRDPEEKMLALKAKLLPNLDKNLRQKELYRKLIETPNLLDFEISALEIQLFPDQAGQNSADIQEFMKTCKALNERHHEFKALFNDLSDDILTLLFPGGFQDMELPAGLKPFAGTLYNLLAKETIVDLIQSVYDPLEDSLPKREAWQSDLQSRLQAPDLKEVLKGPTTFGLAFAKDFIQSNPKAVTYTVKMLDQLGVSLSSTPITEMNQQETLFADLSKEHLADWFVKSVQTLANTKDPYLLGLGEFFDKSLNNLILAILDKGAKLAIPDQSRVQGDQLVKVLTDQLIAKLGTFTGKEEISVQFWTDFLSDLPIPSLAKELVVPILVEKSKILQQQVKEKIDLYTQVDQLYQETEAEVKKYHKGEELLSISEKLSEQIVNQLLEKQFELLNTFGLGDTFEEMLAQYLPGVKVDDDLKKWFKDNIASLQDKDSGAHAKSVALLKRMIEAVILKALDNTLKATITKKEDYAAQLLSKIHQSFITAIGEFDDAKRVELAEAYSIDAAIQIKQDEIDRLRAELAEMPKGLTPKQELLLSEAFKSNMRLLRAEEYLNDLQATLNGKIDELNISGKQFTKEQLSFMTKAVEFHNSKSSQFSKKDDYLAYLKEEIERSNQALRNPGPDIAKDASNMIKTLNLLRELLEMPPSGYQIVTEAVALVATIENAEKERGKLQEDVTKRLKEVNDHEFEKVTNREIWEKAVPWMKGLLPKRSELHRLTKEITALRQQLDSKLTIFQNLSKELTKLLGLEKKDDLKLPDFILEIVWPLIEEAKTGQFARLLFGEFAAVILTIVNVDDNEKKLIQLSNGDTFLVQLAANISNEAVDRLSDYVTNYRPYAEMILKFCGNSNPTKDQIDKMEKELRLMMIDVGRESGITVPMIASLLEGIIPADKVNAISLLLDQWIKEDNAAEMTEKAMADLLRPVLTPVGFRDEESLKKLAQKLSYQINEFLISQGKGNLTPLDLKEAYEKADQPLKLTEVDKVLDQLQREKVIEKIKTVVITHDQIARILNGIIPGAEDLHSLIAPELESMIIGTNKDLQQNRQFLKDYIEGFLLQFFVKIAEANFTSGKSVMEVLANKLKEKVPTPQDLVGKTPLEVARKKVDEVLKDVLGISSLHDLDGIPIALRQVVYEKMKERAYLQMTPLFLLMIERDQRKIELERASGSPFFGHLSTAISRDLFSLIPVAVSSYRAIALELFTLLSSKKPSDAEIEEFAKEIDSLVQLDKKSIVTSADLANAYAKVAKTTVQPSDIQKLESQKALERILNIVKTPEEITDSLGKVLPTVDKKLLSALAAEMHHLTHSQAYESFSAFGEAAIEGVLLKVLHHIAVKNPPSNGDDSLIVLTNKLLDEVTKKLEQIKKDPPSKERIVQELNDWILADLLGIGSPDAFQGLPDSIKETAYRMIKDEIGQLLVRIQQGIGSLSAEKGEDKVAKGNVALLAQDLANLIIKTVPQVLTGMGTHKMMGVNAISKGVESYLEELAHKQIAVGSVIAAYPQAGKLQDILGNVLKTVGAEKEHQDEKKIAAELAATLIYTPLNRLIEKTIEFEDKKGVAFDRKLMANVLQVAAGHLQNLNRARDSAAAGGRGALTHEDFVKAAKGNLHPAVPVEAVSFNETIEAVGKTLYGNDPLKWPAKWSTEQPNLREKLIKLSKQDTSGEIMMTIDHVIAVIQDINKEVTSGNVVLLDQAQSDNLKNYRNKQRLDLRDLIRKEWEAPKVQRQKEFYAPNIQTLMTLIFPNGKGDLTFVPEELRNTVWKIFEDNLFPVVLPMITELVLNPNTINQMVLTSLEVMRDSLGEPIVLEEGEPADRPLDELDKASGALIKETLKLITLPDWIKKLLIDKDTQEISPSMQKALGAVLRKQFNGKGLEDIIKKGLETAVARDKDGNYLLNPDQLESKGKADLKKIGTVSRQVVEASAGYYFRSIWVHGQARFDKVIEESLGPIGTKLKRALDAVFNFIVFKIIGSFLNLLIYPFKGYLKEKIYNYILLDKNLETIMSLFTKAPTDQPLTEGHVVYNEGLIYNIVKAIEDSVREFLSAPASTIVPSLKMENQKSSIVSQIEGLPQG